MPFFSAIIPTYNREKLIARTLDSVLTQTFDDVEIVVVDDGSTDDTVQIVQAYADRDPTRFKLLQQSNAGPGEARNLGIHAAGGEYLAMLDSDDVWFPWTLATYKRIIDEHDRPAFIAGKSFVFENDQSPLPTAPEELKVNAFADYYAAGDQWRWFSASSFVMRRDAVMAAGGFTDAWVNAEDADLAMRVGAWPGFIQVLSPPTFGYRQHAGSAMSNLDRTLAGVMAMVNAEKAGQYPGGEARRNDRERLITLFVRPLCASFVTRGEIAKAWALYKAAFGWHVRQGRGRFLFGIPAVSVASLFRGRRT